MEQEQIIKALECCGDAYDCLTCNIYKRGCTGGFRTNMARNALALIEELTEENERLKAENVDCRLGFKLLEDAFKKLEKINEQCEEEKALLEKQFEEVHDIIESNIRAEIADNGSSCP